MDRVFSLEFKLALDGGGKREGGGGERGGEGGGGRGRRVGKLQSWISKS